jgi:hypothetical protein
MTSKPGMASRSRWRWHEVNDHLEMVQTKKSKRRFHQLQQLLFTHIPNITTLFYSHS